MYEHWTDEERARAAASAQEGPEAAAGGPAKQGEAGGKGSPLPADAQQARAGTGEPPARAPADTPANTSAEGADDALTTIMVNGEERTFTPQELAPIVENGLRWEAFRDSYEKLGRLAALAGRDTPALIDAMERASARARLAPQEQLQQRLADEYLELAREFPGKFRSFADVPKSVVEAALGQGIPLYDAYLRHERSEEKRAADARARQTQAAGQSAGSLKSDPVSIAPEIEAFLQGFNRSLK